MNRTVYSPRSARWRLPFSFGGTALHLVLILTSIIALVPFVWMVATSLKGAGEVLTATPTFFPKEWRWENYVEAFQQIPFARFYFNTVFVTGLRVVGQLLVASLAAYSFARMRFPGRNLLFVLVLAVLMVPGQITLIRITCYSRTWVGSTPIRGW